MILTCFFISAVLKSIIKLILWQFLHSDLGTWFYIWNLEAVLDIPQKGFELQEEADMGGMKTMMKDWGLQMFEKWVAQKQSEERKSSSGQARAGKEAEFQLRQGRPSLPDLHIVGREEPVGPSAHPPPPALVNHLYVGDDIVGVKGDLVITSWNKHNIFLLYYWQHICNWHWINVEHWKLIQATVKQMLNYQKSAKQCLWTVCCVDSEAILHCYVR